MVSTGWDLFTGIGGIHAGMAIAGITPVLGVEFDPRDPTFSLGCKEIYKLNDWQVRLETVQGFVGAGCPGLPIGADLGHISLLCGDYSKANLGQAKNNNSDPVIATTKKAKNDNRDLAIAAMKALEIGNPVNFSLEQVSEFKDSDEYNYVYAKARELGYILNEAIANVGAISGQRRQRLILTGSKLGIWTIPALEPKTWFEVLTPILQSLEPIVPTQKQVDAVKKFLSLMLPGDRTSPLFVERISVGRTPKVAHWHQQAPCLVKSQFRDQKGAGRSQTHCIRIGSTWLNLDLRAIALLSGFPSWYKYLPNPAISGAGMGYAVPPNWYAELIRTMPR